SPEEAAVWEDFGRIAELPPDQLMSAFMAKQLRPGVEPPPPPLGPPPPWMSSRPPTLKTVIQAFMQGELDLDVFTGSAPPAYFAPGALITPDYYARTAARLPPVFADFTLEVFEDRPHFDPPHRIEPERVASSLQALWARGEELASSDG